MTHLERWNYPRLPGWACSNHMSVHTWGHAGSSLITGAAEAKCPQLSTGRKKQAIPADKCPERTALCDFGPELLCPPKPALKAPIGCFPSCVSLYQTSSPWRVGTLFPCSLKSRPHTQVHRLCPPAVICAAKGKSNHYFLTWVLTSVDFFHSCLLELYNSTTLEKLLWSPTTPNIIENAQS